MSGSSWDYFYMQIESAVREMVEQMYKKEIERKYDEEIGDLLNSGLERTAQEARIREMENRRSKELESYTEKDASEVPMHPMRRRVLEHLEALAEVCRDIEWSDSGDTEPTQWIASAERLFDTISEESRMGNTTPHAPTPNARNGNEGGTTEKTSCATQKIVVTRKIVTTEASWHEIPKGEEPAAFGSNLVENLREDPFEGNSEWLECEISQPYDYKVDIVDERAT